MLLLENRPYLDTVERLVLVQAFLFLLLSFVALVWYLLSWFCGKGGCDDGRAAGLLGGT